MNPVFVDTSYILALELVNDQNHQAAQTHWQRNVKTLPPLVTTSYVFDEIVTYFNSRSYHSKAIQVGQMLLRSSSVELLHIDSNLFQAGWIFFQRHHDKTYSLTDCLSFVVMQQRKIQIAFTFDHHFSQAGFQKEPS